MDRKSFIKTTGVTIGLAFLPSILTGKTKYNGLSSDDLTPKIVRDDKGQVLNVIGDIQMHKISGKDTNNQIVEWVNDVAPGVGIPTHIHTKEDEIFRVIKGKVELIVGNETTVLEAGDIAFAPKNIPHAWKIVGDEHARMSTSAFPAGIEVMFAELGAMPEGPPDFLVVAEICGKYGITFA